MTFPARSIRGGQRLQGSLSGSDCSSGCLKQYREGTLSLGSMAKSLDISVGEAIDMLAEFGIESPVAYEDYLKGFDAKW